MNKYIKMAVGMVTMAIVASCTKLDQNLNSTLTNEQAANALGAAFVLQNAYNDVGNPYSDNGNIFALEEVPADECLIPTRGSDWDDNGKWRALHQHTWTIDGVDAFLAMFNAMNKINFDATNVLTPSFKASKEQIAEARFIRAIALYQILDLWGQFPFRPPGDNLLNAPKVYTGDSAVQFIISELKAAIPDLAPGNSVIQANVDAANFLLMRLYLNHGAFVNRSAPTFSDDDMNQVITLGNTILNNPKYSYSKNFFDNFGPLNDTSHETIFACPNTAGVVTNNTGIHNKWWSTLHYNQYFSKYGSQGGWNGFSTVADFYNTFGVNATMTATPNDTLIDPRIGGRVYKGSSDVSGVRPGILIGQQYDEKGKPYTDRKGNPLIFVPGIAPDLKELGANLEVTGYRILKYPADYSNNGANYNNTAGNWAILFRYSDALLMVAEAMMRKASPDNAGALALVNKLRLARGTTAMTSMTINDANDVYAPNTLLAERGREMYWEATRRTDLIRFGMFLKPWAYKSVTGDTKNLLYPIPTAALAANPNLKQNTGY